jgi:hypothetical protein
MAGMHGINGHNHGLDAAKKAIEAAIRKGCSRASRGSDRGSLSEDELIAIIHDAIEKERIS